MSRRPAGQNYPHPIFGGLAPERVLADYDGAPCFYVSRTILGDMLLVYRWDEKPEYDRFLVVPTSPTIIDRVESGAMTMRDSLMQPWKWLVDVANDGTVVAAWRVERVPDATLPVEGIHLHD